jgi:hypothetical protein
MHIYNNNMKEYTGILRNKEGGNLQDMCTFNNFINSHGLVEIPILGQAFTWSNMQESPLLEQVEWIFSLALWTLTFPNTEIKPLSRNTSDHVPLLISVGTDIPEAKIFRFEILWLDCHGFMNMVENAWAIPSRARDCAWIISSKLKNTRKALKNWGRNTSRLSMWMDRCNLVLNLLDGLEEQRPLSIPEFNFRNILKKCMANLLHYKRIYCKNRIMHHKVG